MSKKNSASVGKSETWFGKIENILTYIWFICIGLTLFTILGLVVSVLIAIIMIGVALI